MEIYAFGPVIQAAQAEGRDPREELFAFIRELRDYARSLKPDFFFIAQNAAVTLLRRRGVATSSFRMALYPLPSLIALLGFLHQDCWWLGSERLACAVGRSGSAYRSLNAMPAGRGGVRRRVAPPADNAGAMWQE
jgi:hypothetical protein